MIHLASVILGLSISLAMAQDAPRPVPVASVADAVLNAQDIADGKVRIPGTWVFYHSPASGGIAKVLWQKDAWIWIVAPKAEGRFRYYVFEEDFLVDMGLMAKGGVSVAPLLLDPGQQATPVP
jgi:hypothetical protein